MPNPDHVLIHDSDTIQYNNQFDTLKTQINDRRKMRTRDANIKGTLIAASEFVRRNYGQK